MTHGNAQPGKYCTDRHPIHPMLIVLPITFFAAAFITDGMSYVSTHIPWPVGSYYLLTAGLVMGVLAALAGVIDFLGSERIRALNAAYWHAGANVLVIALETLNWYLRTDPAAPVTTMQFGLSIISVLLLLFSGWMGGELVYRHRVAVMNEPDR